MTAQRGLALMFVTGVLVVMAEYESTSHLSVALAVLIMTSVILVYGTKAIENVKQIVGAGGMQQTTTRITSGRYAGKTVPLG